jgi:thioredoxin
VRPASYAEAVATDLPVLVDVWAAWCGPCRAVAPAVEEASRRYAGRLKVVKVDADRSPGVGRSLGVQGIPALFLLRGGHVVDTRVGALPSGALQQWVGQHVTATQPS